MYWERAYGHAENYTSALPNDHAGQRNSSTVEASTVTGSELFTDLFEKHAGFDLWLPGPGGQAIMCPTNSEECTCITSAPWPPAPRVGPPIFVRARRRRL